jgi:4-diphosphocytidyl-2-C-methyl-D-erythritol kinase
MALEALAPAKINLFLHVGAPEADGYHPISSLMAFADIGDRVHAAPAGALGLKVIGPFGNGLSADDDNLVMRAAHALLLRAGGVRRPIALTLDKRLPVAAGLGGGSSDAGAALRLLREALEIDLTDDALEAVAAGLGADGAACLWARPVIAEGRGERLSPAPAMPALDVVLVNPGAAVATPAVYRAYDAAGRFGGADRPPMPETFESAADVAGWLTLTRNDLEAPAVDLAPEIGDVLALIGDEPETLFARMSGSGATCFALCASDVEAEGLAERLEALKPDWWVRRCRLVG